MQELERAKGLIDDVALAQCLTLVGRVEEANRTVERALANDSSIATRRRAVDYYALTGQPDLAERADAADRD